MDSTQEQDAGVRFTYADLPDPGTHIRLIRVTKAEEGKTIRCELSIWSRDSAPPYNAISYTWGNPADTGVIVLNAKNTAVRSNCEYVLRQSYWHDPKAYIWVDALCINQDDIAEKSVQVAMMGEIYEHARLVLACVGPHVDDSEYLLRTIRNNERLCISVPKDIDLEVWDFWWDGIPRGLYLQVWQWLLRYSFSFKRLSRAHTAFLERRYFFRVWVLQELFMAKEVIVCCGNDRIPLRLLPGHMWLLSLVATLKFERPDLAKYSGSGYGNPWNLFVTRFLTRWIGLESSRNLGKPTSASYLIEIGSQQSDQVLALERTLIRLSGLHCHDRRDMVYATLSMLDWCGKPEILPDYNKSCFQLALEILVHSAGRSGGLANALASWLVENLQLHRENETGTRILSLSLLGPDPPAPREEKAHANHRIFCHGYTLISRKSQRGVFIQTGTIQDLTDTFPNPALETVEMRPGDIVIRQLGKFSRLNCMIVAREQSLGCFRLVGYTAFESRLSIHEYPRADFWIYFDSEDLLMFSALIDSLDQLPRGLHKDTKGNETLLQMLSRRVCRYELSSYAVRTPEIEG